MDSERRPPLSGDEFAEQIALGAEWDPGASCPLVFAKSGRALVAFKAPSVEEQLYSLIEFTHPYVLQFGLPGDETIPGHPLYGKGLSYYNAHIVHNSSWIERARTIEAVHYQFSAERWKTLKHYILTFHDDTFECLAKGVDVVMTLRPLQAVLDGAVALLEV